jgi:1-acyl-sn-glycerol-3-phosphate acyltransferase
VSAPADLDLPWTRTPPVQRFREFVVCAVLGPLMDVYTRRTVVGRERLERLPGPVLFVANHSSHMDTPVILRALPGRWRRRTAVAAAVDYFFTKRRNAISSSVVFGTVPMDRNGGGLGPEATAHLDRLVQNGGSLLMFAEGTRSHDGTVSRLRSGAAVLAAEHGLPIVPIYVGGTNEAMPRGHHWMRFKAGRPGPRHPLAVRFGEPIPPGTVQDRDEIMERIRLFLAESGADTVPPPALAPERQPA